MGLRHLCVVDARKRVVGVITRKDLVNAFHMELPETSLVQDPKVLRMKRKTIIKEERAMSDKDGNGFDNVASVSGRGNSDAGL